MNDTRHDALEGLVDDARAVIGRGATTVRPDFAAVIARARALENAAPLPMAADDDDDDGAGEAVAGVRGADVIDALVGDARASIERAAESRRMKAIPPMPAPPQRRRRIVAWSAVALTAAAAAFVVFALRPGAVLESSRDRVEPTQAARGLDGEADVHEAVDSAPPQPAAPHRDSPASTATPIPDEEPAPIVEPVAPQTSRPIKTVDNQALLRSLDDEARRRWAAGDRVGAEAKFVEITAKGGKTTVAELAWGDLFTLARQRHDDTALVGRWKKYLARFPRGRYADDARAGLCRTRDEAACWASYLRDFPRGSYRAEAADGVGE